MHALVSVQVLYTAAETVRMEWGLVLWSAKENHKRTATAITSQDQSTGHRHSILTMWKLITSLSLVFLSLLATALPGGRSVEISLLEIED